jgi:hypothetical protein
MRHHLMTKHIPVNPTFIGPPFGKPQFSAVKFAGFRNVPNLNRKVKGSDHTLYYQQSRQSTTKYHPCEPEKKTPIRETPM